MGARAAPGRGLFILAITKRLPPYGRAVIEKTYPRVAYEEKYEMLDSLIVLTGSRGFGAAHSERIFYNKLARVVLPFGEAPDGYRWPVEGRDCMIKTFGKPESAQALVWLAGELISAGAPFVLLSADSVFGYPTVKIEGK